MILRRLAPLLLAMSALAVVVRLTAQEPARTDQTFRTGVDVIRLDVTVLDKARKPVRGLGPAEFVVKENGRPQRIVAVTEVDAAAGDPSPSAWMRYTGSDVTSNDLGDRLGEGQAVAIVLDDYTIPDDSVETIVAARELARYIINSLGPSDVVAIVYPFKPGRTEDFTSDRLKLMAAIDKFEPEQPEFLYLQPRYSGPMEGDIQRYNTALGRHPCLQIQPVIPTLRAVTSRLATVPNRRKALYYLSQGINFVFRPGNTKCQAVQYDEMRKTFEMAQRFNVVMHGIDPAGAAGYQRYLQQPRVRNLRVEPGRDLIAAQNTARVRHDFLRLLSDQTGGRPVFESDDVEGSVAEIMEEYGSYYLIGYETTNGEPDGKFRRIDVDVPGRDLEVLAKSGRWAPNHDSVVESSGPRSVRCLLDCWYEPPKPSDFHLAGLEPAQPLRLRAALYPLARSGAPLGEASKMVEVAAVLTIRMPAVLRAVDDTLTIVRTAYDAADRAAAPQQMRVTRSLTPEQGDVTEYEVWTRFSLAPGRHRVRFNASSRVADDSGTVNVELDVPDLSQSELLASPIVLGSVPTVPRTDQMESLLPIVPTTSRNFVAGDRVTAFVRLFAGDAPLAGPVGIDAKIVDADDRIVVEVPRSTIGAAAFATTHAADYTLDLPLTQLKSGLHLLSVTATFDPGKIVRRDLVFRVR